MTSIVYFGVKDHLFLDFWDDQWMVTNWYTEEGINVSNVNAMHLIIADKDGIWIYSRTGNVFDRNCFIKKYWKELEVPEEFNRIKKLVGK